MMKNISVIQITESFLKIALACAEGRSWRITETVVIPLGGTGDGDISDKIAGFFKDRRIKAPGVILSLSRNTVTVRNLHLPSQERSEIIQMIDLNIVRVVPYKKEDVVFGHRLLGQDEKGYTRAMLAIVRIETARRLTGIVERAGLELERVVLGSFLSWRKIVADMGNSIEQETLYLALDVDAEFTDLMIFSSRELVFTRSINIGERAMSENGEAARFKFVTDVKQYLMMFYNEEMNRRPAAVYLCGVPMSGILLRGLADEIGIPIGELPVSQHMSRGGVSLASVCGLQKQDDEGLTFLLPEIQARKILGENMRDLLLLGSLFLYAAMLVFGLSWARLYVQENYLKRVQAAKQTLERQMGDLPEIARRVQFVKGVMVQRKLPVRLLAELQVITPPGVALTSIALDADARVILKGQAEQLEDVFKFIDQLENAETLSDVLTRSTKKRKVRDKDLTDFELSFLLKKAHAKY